MYARVKWFVHDVYCMYVQMYDFKYRIVYTSQCAGRSSLMKPSGIYIAVCLRVHYAISSTSE